MIRVFAKEFISICYDKHMKEVVWVFGTSASGKETFIKSVLKDAILLEQLGWKYKSVVACEQSTKFIGQFKRDPKIILRESIIKKVPTLLSSADVVLIKWQFVDSQTSRPQRLKEAIPEAQHRIILLNTPESELIERLARKKWWHDYGEEKEFISKELSMVGDCIKQLSPEFMTTTLNSGTYSNYRPSL